jgi:hemolysin-activating ACP:hemolysin acyltransferase
MTQFLSVVMAKLRAPFGCERIIGEHRRNVFGDMPPEARWRIHDANDDAIASVPFPSFPGALRAG